MFNTGTVCPQQAGDLGCLEHKREDVLSDRGHVRVRNAGWARQRSYRKPEVTGSSGGARCPQSSYCGGRLGAALDVVGNRVVSESWVHLPVPRSDVGTRDRPARHVQQSTSCGEREWSSGQELLESNASLGSCRAASTRSPAICGSGRVAGRVTGLVSPCHIPCRRHRLFPRFDKFHRCDGTRGNGCPLSITSGPQRRR